MAFAGNIRARIATVLAAVAVALLPFGCTEPEADLEGEVSVYIVEPQVGPSAGSKFVNISAPCDWNIRIKGDCTWARLSASEGSGDGHVTLTWDVNDSGANRAIVIQVATPSGRFYATCEFTQTVGSRPSGSDDLIEDQVQNWMELPAMSESNNCFITHSMSVGQYYGRNYSYLLDPDALVALWVAYPLNRGLRSSGSRTNAWGVMDPRVPRKNQAVLEYAYGGGYQRGHQIPSADRLSPDANVQTFYGTNMTPQNGDLNEGVWAALEGIVRNWSYQFDTLYVVTGCDIKGSTKYAYDNDGKAVKVPVGYFKALLGYKKSHNVGITDQTGGYTSIAFYFQNKGYREDDIKAQAMTVRDLEKKMGYNFFVNLEDKARGGVGKTLADKVEQTNDPWWLKNLNYE